MGPLNVALVEERFQRQGQRMCKKASLSFVTKCCCSRYYSGISCYIVLLLFLNYDSELFLFFGCVENSAYNELGIFVVIMVIFMYCRVIYSLGRSLHLYLVGEY